MTQSTTFYDLSVSRNLFSEAVGRQFDPSGNQRIQDCREPGVNTHFTLKIFKCVQIIDVNQRLLIFDQTITALENRLTEEKKSLEEFTHQDLLGGVNITEIRETVSKNRIDFEQRMNDFGSETQVAIQKTAPKLSG